MWEPVSIKVAGSCLLNAFFTFLHISIWPRIKWIIVFEMVFQVERRRNDDIEPNHTNKLTQMSKMFIFYSLFCIYYLILAHLSKNIIDSMTEILFLGFRFSQLIIAFWYWHSVLLTSKIHNEHQRGFFYFFFTFFSLHAPGRCDFLLGGRQRPILFY